MLFNSISFFLFFPVTTFLYYLVPSQRRWVVLLTASCIFYMAFIPVYIGILFYLIIIDYFVGIFLDKKNTQEIFRKYLLWTSIFSNIGILVFFKYFNFIQINIQALAYLIHWNYSPQLLGLILPIGLSFHTFQSLSYVIDIYQHKQKAEKHFGRYALFVMFYPQLVAGPIERAKELLPQFKRNYHFDEASVSEGLRRILLGFFKKLIIADRLAILVNHVYGHPQNYIGFPLILATVAFAFQIYCDFSGYSDIAIGAAKVMGFTLSENFVYPYLATSIPDFWRRWHKTLYSWFRDYLYIPLGGNRKGKLVQTRNILVVFLATGLWHGASWNYVLWGLIHGVYVIGSLFIGKVLTIRLPFTNKIFLLGLSSFKTIGTFTLVCIAWVFFRASSISDGWYILSHAPIGLFGLLHLAIQRNFYNLNYLLFDQHHGVGLSIPQVEIALGAVILLEVLQYIDRKNAFVLFPFWVRFGYYVSLTLIVINLGPADQVPFIYFKF